MQRSTCLGAKAGDGGRFGFDLPQKRYRVHLRRLTLQRVEKRNKNSFK
jgi:hypothetical protein